MNPTLWLPWRARHPAIAVHLEHAPIDGLRIELAGTEPDQLDVSERSTEPGVLELTLRGMTDSSDAMLSVFVPTPDAVALWRPGGETHFRIASAWESPQRVSPLNGVPLGCLLGQADLSRVTYAVRYAGPVALRVGNVEETAEFMLAFETPTAVDSDLVVRLDLREVGFVDAVAEARAWLSPPRTLPGAVPARGAVLSTWYSLHQNVTTDNLLEQARAAQRYGLETIIIDDGWQNADADRGYASCGDWRPEPTKIADAAALVAGLEELGLRTMWWIGTAFVGDASAAAAAGVVPVHHHDPIIRASVLDVRSPAARSYLIERLDHLVRSTGCHGLKLDFIERFTNDDDDEPPGDADFESSEAAAVQLLADIRDRGRAIRDDFMIEFRQPYVGPVAEELGTMLRVADCPLSPVQNRLGIIDLRLAAPDSVPHADMVMWGPADSPERVAQHLINTLLGVPQISVDFVELDLAHGETLAFWLAFWREHRVTLLNGGFRPTRPDLLFPVVEVRHEDEVIVLRHADTTVRVPDDDWSTWHVVNADAPGVVLTAAAGLAGASCAVRDCRGRLLEEGTLGAGDVLPIDVPTGGLATITRK